METLAAFLSHLEHERRLAGNTVEAYGSDLADFFNFLRVHLGDEPTPKALGRFRNMDRRA